MTAEYVTKDNDTIDLIAWRHYGTTDNHVVESLLKSNPGLANLGAILPAGCRIRLPEISNPPQKQGVRLWD